MTEPAAFQGVLVDVDFMKTTGALRFVIEVAKENATAALDIVGGLPDPATSRWVAVARIVEEKP